MRNGMVLDKCIAASHAKMLFFAMLKMILIIIEKQN